MLLNLFNNDLGDETEGTFWKLTADTQLGNIWYAGG